MIFSIGDKVIYTSNHYGNDDDYNPLYSKTGKIGTVCKLFGKNECQVEWETGFFNSYINRYLEPYTPILFDNSEDFLI